MNYLADVLGVQTDTNWGDVTKLVWRFALDVSMLVVVVQFVYAKLYRNRTNVFTYYIFNLVTYALCALLRKVPAELGFALAIFAVFGILRYRTEQIRMRDLTYLFIVIGLGIINAIANKKISLPELLIANFSIVLVTVLLERGPFAASEVSVPLRYDRLDMLKPEARGSLHKDIAERMGITASRIEVEHIDFLRDSADIIVYYRPSRGAKGGT
jgi:hypothetical protein